MQRRGTLRRGNLDNSPNLAGRASILQNMAGMALNSTSGPAAIIIPEPTTCKKKDGKKAEGEDVNLESPTSIKMKNSLLIKHADPSFDVMAQMKKKKSIYSYSG